MICRGGSLRIDNDSGYVRAMVGGRSRILTDTR